MSSSRYSTHQIAQVKAQVRAECERELVRMRAERDIWKRRARPIRGKWIMWPDPTEEEIADQIAQSTKLDA